MIAQALLLTFATYAALGLAIAVYFVTFGIGRIDPAARAASIAFRLMLVPGSAALWPVLLPKCVRGMGGPPMSLH
jgi:hypothetical protein